MTRIGTICAAVLAVAGCGGGGGNPGTCFGSPEVCDGVAPAPPPPGAGSPVGLYRGTTSTGRSAHTLVLPNGEFWLLYGEGTTGTVLAGLVQGNSTSSNGAITSPNLVDVSSETAVVTSGALDGSFVPRSRISGRLVFGTAVATFSGDYALPTTAEGTLAQAQGTYAGTAATLGQREAATVAVTDTGVVTGVTASGCSFSGTLQPVTEIHAFALSLTFGGPPCAIENGTARGVAFRDGSRLHGGTVNAARTDGFAFTGVR